MPAYIVEIGSHAFLRHLIDLIMEGYSFKRRRPKSTNALGPLIYEGDFGLDGGALQSMIKKQISESINHEVTVIVVRVE